MTAKPTQQVYEELQNAYEFFNRELFEGRLPSCVITLQRQHDTYGYFSANQFQTRVGGVQAHEIALNPSYFAVRTIHETLSVLVREMVSLDQTLNTKRDKLPRRRYRNTEWADMCERVGLMPTATGLPGGRRVGDNVQTYVIEGGLFDVACSRFVDETFTLSWVDRFPPQLLPEAQEQIGEGSAETVPEYSTQPNQGVEESIEPDKDAASNQAATSFDGLASLIIAGGDEDGSPVTDVFEGVSSPALDTPAAPVPENKKPTPPPMKLFERVEVESLHEQGIEPRERVKNVSKTPFQCASCGAKAWGKPSLQIGCYGAPDSPHEALMMAVAQK